MYYHLGAYDEALQFALAAGDRFELERTQVLEGKGKAGEGYIEVIIGELTLPALPHPRLRIFTVSSPQYVLTSTMFLCDAPFSQLH